MSRFKVEGFQAKDGILQAVSYTLHNPETSGQSASESSAPDSFILSVFGTLYYYQKTETFWLSARINHDKPQGSLDYFEVNFGRNISRLLPLDKNKLNSLQVDESHIKALISGEREKQKNASILEYTTQTSAYKGPLTEAQQAVINILLKNSGIEKPETVEDEQDVLSSMQNYLKPKNINVIRFNEEKSTWPTVGTVHDYLLHCYGEMLNHNTQWESLKLQTLSPFFYKITVGDLGDLTALKKIGLNAEQYAMLMILLNAFRRSFDGIHTIVDLRLTLGEQKYIIHLLDRNTVKTDTEDEIINDFVAIANCLYQGTHEEITNKIAFFISHSLGILKNHYNMRKNRVDLLMSSDPYTYLQTLSFLEAHETILDLSHLDIETLDRKFGLESLTDIPAFLTLSTLNTSLKHARPEVYKIISIKFFSKALNNVKSFDELFSLDMCHGALSLHHPNIIKNLETRLNGLGMSLAGALLRLTTEEGIDKTTSFSHKTIRTWLIEILPCALIPFDFYPIHYREPNELFFNMMKYKMPLFYTKELLELADLLHVRCTTRSFIENTQSELDALETPQYISTDIYDDILQSRRNLIQSALRDFSATFKEMNEQLIAIGINSLSKKSTSDIIEDTDLQRSELLSNIFKYCTAKRAAMLLQEPGPIKNLLLALLPDLDSIHILMIELPRERSKLMDPALLQSIIQAYDEIKDTMTPPASKYTYNRYTGSSSRAEACSAAYLVKFKLEMNAYFGEDAVEQILANNPDTPTHSGTSHRMV